MMHTEIYCDNLDNLDKAKAVRAVHQALLQLQAIGNRAQNNGITYDNSPAIKALIDVMIDVGHAGFSK